MKYMENLIIFFTNEINFLINSLDTTTAFANIIAIISAIIVCVGWIFTKITQLYRLKKFDKTKRPLTVNEQLFEQYIYNFIKTRIAQLTGKQYTFNKFIRKILIKGKKQYHLILGESGTGKTTFLLNLYYRYSCRVFKHNYYIEYFSLRTDGVLKKISEISNQKQTILLLDGFDEAIDSNNNPEQFLNKVEETTKCFAKIVITSRNNFFDSDASVPSKVGVVPLLASRPDKYNRYYVQPVTLGDIIIYLLKKYKIKVFSIIKATKLIKRCRDIVCRPLILSYIDVLIKQDNAFNNSSEIYDQIINNWIDRESFYLEGNDEKAKQLIEQQMHTIVNEIAVYMYNKYPVQKDYYIRISDLNSIQYTALLENRRRKSDRSLFNRIDDKLFFAHRSILEYLLALNIDRLNFRFDPNLNILYGFLEEFSEYDVTSKYATLFYVNYRDKTPELIQERKENNTDCILASSRNIAFSGRKQIESIVGWQIQALMMPVILNNKFYKRSYFQIDILGKQIVKINAGDVNSNQIYETELEAVDWIMEVIKTKYIMKKISFTITICSRLESYER